MHERKLETWSYWVPTREFVLVSGPMTGYQMYNLPLLKYVCNSLRRTNINAFNPFEEYTVEELERKHYSYFHTQYLPAAAHERCAGICALDGWEKSKGARIEVFTATTLGKPFFVYREADGAAHLQLREAVIT